MYDHDFQDFFVFVLHYILRSLVTSLMKTCIGCKLASANEFLLV